jgi:metallo-beta-lactamase family protein
VRYHKDSLRLRDVDQSMLIIAGSGMCTGGRIVGHMKDLLPKPETCVIFVGHQAAGTPGRAIQDAFEKREQGGESSVRLAGQDIELRADVEVLRGISSHAGRDELKAWLDAIPNVKHVALHHGDEAAQNAFASFYAGQPG